VKLTNGGLSSSGSAEDLVLSTYDDEDKAKITLEAGAGGGVVVQTDAAGVLQVENTTTDTDSVLSIMGNGPGDAKIDLQNASKRVWVLCDENKKLKMQGGAAGNTFVFDVTSAAGGITWPDGSTQITASSGGGATLNHPLYPSCDYSGLGDGTDTKFYPLQLPGSPVNQTTSGSGCMLEDTTKMVYFPFFNQRESGDIASIIYRQESASTGTVVVGLYSTTAANAPGTKIGDTATLNVASSGEKETDTSALSWTVEADTVYWLGLMMTAVGLGQPDTRHWSGGWNSWAGMPQCNGTAVEGYVVPRVCAIQEDSLSGALPASATLANCVTTGPAEIAPINYPCWVITF
jgi:hypothetical protein